MATLTINTTNGTGWSGDPVSGMNAVWSQAVSDLQTALVPPVNNVNLTITRNFSGGGLGSSGVGVDTTSYANIRSAYLGLTPSNSVQSANWTSANIPSTAPTAQLLTFMNNINTLSMAIGRISGSTTATITLGTGGPWDTSAVRGDTSGSGYTAYGVIMHEMTECLGRIAFADTQTFTSAMDNFTFSAPGTHCTTKATTRYISALGGGLTPVMYNMNTGSGDAGDDTGSSPCFTATTGQNGIISRSSSLPLQAADWQWMTLIGWNLSATGLAWAGLDPSFSVAGNSAVAMTGAATNSQAASLSGASSLAFVGRNATISGTHRLKLGH